MRSIVISFLIWQCCSHRIVSCTQTKGTIPPAGTTHSAIDGTIAHVDRKDSAIVTDRNSVAKISRSEIVVGQRPVVDTSLGRNAKETNPANDSGARPCGSQGPTGDHEVDGAGRSIDSSSERTCVPPRHCDSTLDERCFASDTGLVRGCDQEYVRDRQSESSDLANEADPIAVEYGDTRQQHLRELREAEDDHDDDNDTSHLRKERSEPDEMYTQGVATGGDDSEAVRLSKAKEEHKKSVPDKKAHIDDELSSDAQDPSGASMDPDSSMTVTAEHPEKAAPAILAQQTDSTDEDGGVVIEELSETLIPEEPPTPTSEALGVTIPEKPQTPAVDSSDVLDSDEWETQTYDSMGVLSPEAPEAVPHDAPQVIAPQGASVQGDESARSSIPEESVPLAADPSAARPSISLPISEPASTMDALETSTPKEPEAEDVELVRPSASEPTEALDGETLGSFSPKESEKLREDTAIAIRDDRLLQCLIPDNPNVPSDESSIESMSAD